MSISRVPSAAEFREGLIALGTIPENYLKHLRVHFHSPSHTTTVGRIAEALGYDSYRGVNLWYGRFVIELGMKMGYAKSELNDFSLIAVYSPPDAEHGQPALTLRPEFIQAIRESGTV